MSRNFTRNQICSIVALQLMEKQHEEDSLVRGGVYFSICLKFL
jgi:hypothetical protein